MKFPLLPLLALTCLLAVSVNAKEQYFGNYRILESKFKGTNQGLKPQIYELEEALPVTEEKNMESEMHDTYPEVEEQSTCIRVACFPNVVKYQVCVCIKRRR